MPDDERIAKTAALDDAERWGGILGGGWAKENWARKSTRTSGEASFAFMAEA